MDNVLNNSEVMSHEESLAVSELRRWVENNTEFKSKKDDEFLLIFLRSCDCDQEMTRKLLTKFYQNKVDIARWLLNRDLADPSIQEALNSRFATALIFSSQHQPAICYAQLPNVDLSKVNIDDYARAASMMHEVGFHFKHCQLNGAVLIVELKNFCVRALLPYATFRNIQHYLDTFLLGMPVKVHGVHVLNCPFLITSLYKTLGNIFLSASIRERVHFHGNNLSSLHVHLSPEWLPEELGGSAGPLKQHQDWFLEQVQTFNDYFLDDNNYGYGK